MGKGKEKTSFSFKGIWRYLLRRQTIGMIFFMACFFSLKESQIFVDRDQSLLYDVLIRGRTEWGESGIFSTAVYQMASITNMNAWLVMFLPFLLAYPYVITVCDDYQSHFIRSTMIRKGFFPYVRDCYWYGIISMTVIGSISLILYTLFCVITCDPLSALNAENQQMLYRVICGKAALRVGRSSGMYYVLPVLTGYIRMLCAFLISGLLSVLGMAWSKNKYFSLCMPCLVYYLLIRTSETLVDNGVEIGQYISPMQLVQNEIPIWLLLLVTAGIVIVVERIFIWMMGREVDRGAC